MKFHFVCALSVAFIACSSDPATTPTDGGTAPPIDAQTKTKPIPTKGGDDDDDDDVIAPPKDAGADADKPVDAGKDSGPPHLYRVFVTKARFTGDLKTQGGGTDGLDGADKICTKAATDAGLVATGWAAWISTTTKDAGARVVDHSPWYLVGSTKKAFDTIDALKSAPNVRIDVNETGTSSQQGSGPLTNRVWTGTSNAGLYNGKGCSDFTDGTSTSSGIAGTYVEASGSANWTRYALQASASCDEKHSIYCFEQ